MAAVELTGEEARAEVRRLVDELFIAHDAINFVREMCELAEHLGTPVVSTAVVLEWLMRGRTRGDQIALDRAAGLEVNNRVTQAVSEG